MPISYISVFLLVFIIGTYNTTFGQVLITTNTDNIFVAFPTHETETDLNLKLLSNDETIISKNRIKYIEKLNIVFKLKTSSRMKGNILDITDSSFKCISPDSIKFEILIKEINFAFSDNKALNKYLDAKIISKQEQIIEIPDTVKRKNFTKFGVTFGHPGSFNVNFGISNTKTTLCLSLGLNGYELGMGFNITSSKYIEVNLLLNVSYLQLNTGINSSYELQDKYYLCIGPLLDFNFYGINTQIGVGYNSDKSKNIPVFAQIGYVYRFNL